jgi:purine-binding chemotaxis protein CheW
MVEGGGNNYYVPAPVEQTAAPLQTADTGLEFIRESLSALRRFGASKINEAWLQKRYVEWSTSRGAQNTQLRGISDADEFLSPFYSPQSGSFWDDDYAAVIKKALPDLPSNNIQVWNIGCGKGYETYSFTCILKSRYPEGHIKIWANDNDVMAISQAPNMVFDLDEVPEYCRDFMVKGRNGYSFNQLIKDSIVFEYHDILNDNPLPELDIILARDILSFLSKQDQERFMTGFLEKLKHRGIAIVGRNEELPGNDWRPLAADPVSVYQRIG